MLKIDLKNYDRIFQRIFRIFKREKKILAFTNYNFFSIIWIINSFEPRFISSTINLRNFLSDFNSWRISFLSLQHSDIIFKENFILLKEDQLKLSGID